MELILAVFQQNEAFIRAVLQRQASHVVSALSSGMLTVFAPGIVSQYSILGHLWPVYVCMCCFYLLINLGISKHVAGVRNLIMVLLAATTIRLCCFCYLLNKSDICEHVAGVRNLIMVLFAATTIRLMIENYLKYGIRLNPKNWVLAVLTPEGNASTWCHASSITVAVLL